MLAVPEHTQDEPKAFQLVRNVGPWVALGLVALLVFGYYAGYQRNQAAWDATHQKPIAASKAATATAPAKKTAATPAKTPTNVPKVSKVVIVSAVTFRKDPSSNAESIRDLKAGERLTYIGQVGSWYKVTDPKGVIGWVSASEKYTKVVNTK